MTAAIHEGSQGPRPSLGERTETSRWGRFVISFAVSFTLVAIVVSCLPRSALRVQLYPAVQPFLQATGLVQRWHLFAPNPGITTRALEARIRFADGRSVRWRPPHGDPIIGAFPASRWRKLTVAMMARDGAELRPGFAAWLASEYTRAGRSPTSVQLIRRSYRAYAPGSGRRGHPPWRSKVIYTWRP